MTECEHRSIQQVGKVNCGCARAEPDVGVFACEHAQRLAEHCVIIGTRKLTAKQVEFDDGTKKNVGLVACNKCVLMGFAEEPAPKSKEVKEVAKPREKRATKMWLENHAKPYQREWYERNKTNAAK